MTVADPGLLAARRLLLERLDAHPGQAVNADLDPAEVGIVGDTAHADGGDSYHLGHDQIRARGGRPRYSVDESPRDQAGLDERASALDVGWFFVRVAGKAHTLRTFSVWLVAQCKAGTPDTAGIREVIYSPDGIVVKRWDRLGVRAGGDRSHLTHTHISKFRDADGHQIAALMRRYLTEIGLLEDEMGLTAEQTRAEVTAGLAVLLKSAAARDTPTGRQVGDALKAIAVTPILTAVLNVDEEILAKLGAADTDPEQVAELLRPVLGDK
ncbi:MAG TPA: hypothetical protein VFT95_16800, partial [Micromonosporaceae bacterium]|nr:hypothetical protein [Micromonosporaceae bacterium]